MTTQTYNRQYAGTVKPRYLRDYKREGLYIFTYSRDVYILHLKYIKANFKNYITTKEGRAYIIITKEA